MEKIKNFLLITLTTILFGCLNSLEISENDVPKNINEFAKAYIVPHSKLWASCYSTVFKKKTVESIRVLFARKQYNA
jgi:hypothetical protein